MLLPSAKNIVSKVHLYMTEERLALLIFFNFPDMCVVFQFADLFSTVQSINLLCQLFFVLVLFYAWKLGPLTTCWYSIGSFTA